MTRLSILNVGIFAVFVSCAHAQTVPVVPAVRAYSPAYELERTKETLRSKATDARIRRFSDEYEKEKLKDASAKKKDKAPEKKAAADKKIMKLKRLIFDRSELLPDSFLEGIASRYEGKEIGLNDIGAIVREVDREYKDRGYFAAKAYVPNQDVRDHILKINLIEGKIDRITVKENKSTSENFVRRNLGVESGDRLNVKELQDNILMFNAANDIKARIAMEPGEKFATTDLDVIVEEPQRVSVSAFADNAGQKSTGVYRAGAFASVRSLTGYRDNLNFGGVVTEGSNAFFGSFDIPEPVFNSRIGFGADYSDTEIVGDEDNYLTVALGDKENEEHTLTLNVAGDANVNNLGAQELAVESSAVGGTLRLKSASSLIGATADSLLSAAALEFNGVGGDIGAAGRYLNVSTERLTASADGSIYLNNVRSAVFEGVNAGREIEITSAADLTLNDATAGGSVKVNGAGSLFANNLRAGGDLLMTAENDLDVSGATAEGSVTLVSRLGDMVAELIGSGGDMKIDAAGNLTAGNINAGEKVSIAADSADLDEVVSGGDMRIAVNSDNIFGRLTSEKGNIALTVENADANLRGSVKAANGRVTVTAGGSVLNAGAPAEGAIIANTVDLTAKNGSIGTSGNYLTVDSSYTEPGWISALAEKGIFISEVNGDMNVRRFASNGDIDMRVESSIMAAPGMDPEVPNFKADNITLHTNGSIGMPDNRLVLALNDNGRGKINLKAETGIAVNKLGDGLVSDYVYNLQSGKVMIGLPSGHANIARVTAVGGFELYVREHTDFYNIWLGISDLEARMMNPPYTEYPSENPIEIMRAPLLDRYKLQTGDGLFMNIGSLTGEEEKLSVGF